MTTKAALSTELEPNVSVMPPVSPGVYGYCDAADPEVEQYYAGDTPGPAGTGGDASATLAGSEAPETGVLVCVDERRVMGVFRKHAYLSAELKFAVRDGREVNLGERRVVEAEQAKVLAEVLEDYAKAKQAGGDALLDFLQAIADETNQRQAALRKLFGQANDAGQTDVKLWGYAGMAVATLNLGATMTRKIVADMTGPIGWGIDVTTDVAVAGINAHYDKNAGPDKVLMAELETLTKELAKKGVGEFDGIVEELYKLQNGGVTEEFVELLLRRIEESEAKMAAQMQKYPTRYASHGGYKRALQRLNALKPLLSRYKAALLPLRGARWLAQKGGKEVVGGVFLAMDLKEALDTWYSQMEQFSSH